MSIEIKKRIEILRELMKERGIDIYIIPSTDNHLSEEIGDYFKARHYMTGFSGSAGTAIITMEEAGLWTDGRYFLQAETQLKDTGIELYRTGNPFVPTIEKFILEKMPRSGILGFDGRLISMNQGKVFEQELSSKNVSINYYGDLINLIWGDRPDISKNQIFEIEKKDGLESTSLKLKRLREYMNGVGTNYHVLSTLEDIAWLLNIKENEEAESQLVLCYVVVGPKETELYIDESKVSKEMEAILADDNIVIKPYSDVYDRVRGFNDSDTILIDPNLINYSLYKSLSPHSIKAEAANPTIIFKVMKNDSSFNNLKVVKIKEEIILANMSKEIKIRLENLRELMKERGIDAYIIPATDNHQSEYVEEYFKSRQYITGFSGSIGTAVILLDEAGLWTEEKYFEQAEEQLRDTGINLYRPGNLGVPTIDKFIVDKIPKRGTVAFDGKVISMAEGRDLEEKVASKNGDINYYSDLMNLIWNDRPPIYKEQGFFVEDKDNEESIASKLKKIRDYMNSKSTNYHILTDLNDIAWLLNFKQYEDVEIPHVLCYAIIGLNEIELYAYEYELSEYMRAILSDKKIIIKPYNDIYDRVRNFGKSDRILLDPSRINYFLYQSLSSSATKVEAEDPSKLFNKNKVNGVQTVILSKSEEIQIRIEKLRELMKERSIDAYIIPSSDNHQSEYVGEYFKAREYMTGFTGSAGTAIVLMDEVGLWTDGRYFLQAENQLADTGINLFKIGDPDVPNVEKFIIAKMPNSGTLGFDGRLIAMKEGSNFEQKLKDKNVSIKYDEDLIDLIWDDRPGLSKEAVFYLEEKFSGESTTSKLERVRAYMKTVGSNYHIITSLDDIAWLFNIRGNDVMYSPLILSYAVIGIDKSELFIDESKLNYEIKAMLAKDGIVIKPYNDIYDAVKEFGSRDNVLLDPQRVNYALYKNLSSMATKIQAANPTILFKAIKNETELENMRKAQIKDGVALTKLMYWIKKNYKYQEVTELMVSDKLEELRKQQEGYLWQSFAPICAFKDHAAMMHYSATKESDARLEEGHLFLIDTGGNYYEGSTDITRTMAMGEVTEEIKTHFTAVVRGMINLSRAKFLYGCRGYNLDILARQPIWDLDLDYKCGTGHGIGYLLNIHEGPAGIRWYGAPHIEDSSTLEEGMVLTNEPGIYIDGSHGIRIENELIVRKGTKNNQGQFMYMEAITFVPIDFDAIDVSQMDKAERIYLNTYHKMVFEKISPFLNEDEKNWLKDYTKEINPHQ